VSETPEPRRWKINPKTYGLDPEDGGPTGTFNGQEWRAQIWPDCPVCGERIEVDRINVQGVGDRFPVFLMGMWQCPNDCDPRQVLASQVTG
jgi:hypothetical protein